MKHAELDQCKLGLFCSKVVTGAVKCCTYSDVDIMILSEDEISEEK